MDNFWYCSLLTMQVSEILLLILDSTLLLLDKIWDYHGKLQLHQYLIVADFW